MVCMVSALDLYSVGDDDGEKKENVLLPLYHVCLWPVFLLIQEFVLFLFQHYLKFISTTMIPKTNEL